MMKRLRGLPKYYVVIIAMLLVISTLPKSAMAQVELNGVVVLVDNTHGEQFDPSDADNGLKLMLDMVNASTRYMVRINEDSPLNDTILQDVDILILPAPDESQTFSTEELGAISRMLNNGGSILITGNPSIDQTIEEYWADTEFRDIGENIALNRFLDTMNITGIRFSNNVTESGGEIINYGDTMFDYTNALNTTSPYIIQLGPSVWNTNHPIFKNINNLVVMTSTLKPIDAESRIGWSYDESFAQYRRGPNTFANFSFPNMSLAEFENAPLSYSAINGTQPLWLSAFEYNNSRIVVCGSTIMFSGMSLALPETDARNSEEWFYQADNRFLFMNMLDWLSEGDLQPPSAIIPILVISSVFIVIGVVYYIVQKKRT
jgi:hypothetical protein